MAAWEAPQKLQRTYSEMTGTARFPCGRLVFFAFLALSVCVCCGLGFCFVLFEIGPTNNVRIQLSSHFGSFSSGGRTHKELHFEMLTRALNTNTQLPVIYVRS